MKTIKARIREWNDMEKQFGTNGAGEIKCKYGFLPEMKHLCGREIELVFSDDLDWIHPQMQVIMEG